MTTIVTQIAAGLDAHGNPMTANRDSIARYDAAIDQLLRYTPAVIDSMTSLIEDEDPVAMGLARPTSTSRAPIRDLAMARELHTSMTGTTMNEREALHATAIAAWIDGVDRRRSILDQVLMRWPTDVLALIVHQLDFFLGDAASPATGRCEAARARRRPPAHRVPAGNGIVRTRRGRPLRAGARRRSRRRRRASGRRLGGPRRRPHLRDARPRGRGHQVHDVREHRLGTGNFTVHLWWHLGLYHLEAGRIDDVLSIYDAEVHHNAPGGPLEMLGASAMLWRLRLDGVDTGDRPAKLADAWQPAAAAPGARSTTCTR